MDILRGQLQSLIQRLEHADNFQEQLEQLVSVLPFNKYEFIISTLLADNKLTYEEYLDIRNAYIDRNLYLSIFEISAPRGFGDTWALGHLLDIVPDFHRPNKKIDSTYKGEYDLLCHWPDEDGNPHIIKIEVKASRAVDREKPEESLYEKALASDSQRPFLMNYQQMKPSCCDVFLWIAVYRDKIRYWVIQSHYIQVHEDFVPQHRNENTEQRGKDFKKEDIYEG
ncbi:hypothetical protein JW978_01395 [Candidatus Dojkabacteria bacterium]|nr:hypothetical protein [Candidatus Dojkabacteria bacterium]